jgi:hypothetical protein
VGQTRRMPSRGAVTFNKHAIRQKFGPLHGLNWPETRPKSIWRLVTRLFCCWCGRPPEGLGRIGARGRQAHAAFLGCRSLCPHGRCRVSALALVSSARILSTSDSSWMRSASAPSHSTCNLQLCQGLLCQRVAMLAWPAACVTGWIQAVRQLQLIAKRGNRGLQGVNPDIAIFRTMPVS